MSERRGRGITAEIEGGEEGVLGERSYMELFMVIGFGMGGS